MTVTVKYFRADWCGPCNQQGPIVTEVKEQYADDSDVDVVKIDVDESQAKANKYNVRSIPTTIVERNGDVMSQMAGLTLYDDLEQEVESALRKS